MGFFDDIANSIPDDAERAVLVKYPQVREAIRKFEATHEEITRANAELTGWFSENWDADAGMTHAAKQALVAKDVRIKALEEGEVTFDQMNAELVKAGYVKASDVDAKLSNVLPKDQFEAQRQRDALSFEHVYVKSAPLISKHAREYNADLDLEAMFAHMTEKGIKDFATGYDSFTAPLQQARNTKKAEADAAANAAAIEAAKAEGRAEAQREQAMGKNGQMPSDSGPGEMGAVQARKVARVKAQQEAAGNNSGGSLGDGSAAWQIMEQINKDRAAGRVN